MEAVYVGWLSIIPAVVAIGLALLTKEVILSLVLGIFSGTMIYSVATGQNIIIGTFTNAINIIIQSVDFPILLLLGLLGALIYLISISGGQFALGRLVTKRVKTKTGTLLATAVANCCIFISPSFHVLSVGAVCRPLCDNARVSRAKLSYMLDATGAPTACIAPVSTWLAGIIAFFPATGIFANKMGVFFQSIPFNTYCIASIIMVFWFCFPKHDYGPMAHYERMAEKEGNLGILHPTTEAIKEEETKGSAIDMILPLVLLIGLTIFFMLYSGGMWTEGYSLTEAMANAATTTSMCAAGLVTLVLTFILYIPRKVVTFKEFTDGIGKGVSSMNSIAIIMTLAWGIGGTCRNLLMTGDFVAHIVEESSFHLGLLPIVLFLISCLLSFATGSSWGTFGIILPLTFSICEGVSPELIIICIAAVLGGSTFGDHCSPISDTTVMASGVADVNHIVHVQTQLPYALTAAGVACIGYLVVGFTMNLLLTIVVSYGLLFIVLIILGRKYAKKEAESEEAVKKNL